MNVGRAESATCIPCLELFEVLQSMMVGADVWKMLIPLNRLSMNVQFVISGRADSDTSIPLPVLFNEVQLMNFGLESFIEAIPSKRLPIKVQFVSSGTEMLATTMPLPLFCKKEQLISKGDEESIADIPLLELDVASVSKIFGFALSSARIPVWPFPLMVVSMICGSEQPWT